MYYGGRSGGRRTGMLCWWGLFPWGHEIEGSSLNSLQTHDLPLCFPPWWENWYMYSVVEQTGL